MQLAIETGTQNPILRGQASPVTKFDKKLKKLITEMSETMLAADGVGLAAPQVGVAQRVVVMLFQLGPRDSRILPLVNPEIVTASEECATAEEGCLSLPKQFDRVTRPDRVTVRFADSDGRPQILTLEGWNARVVQHEIDHLNGVLFVDRVAQPVAVRRRASNS